MFLKEIIINGFKSFADRTRILMRPGVTTIVGPNGCGKSNIVDAIRWVLGEQSAKALRGGKMDDVIFQGTDKRKALNLCEVTLIFTECEEQLGTAFNEIEVTRRVTRDETSDYFLNGKRSRLKDIQALFMDTGIGRESYSFMMQGKIDQILSSKPDERRAIFEEAAGITRYKTQRKDALSKLGLVDQNLSRAIDVMEEVGKQKNSVQRQASKALRYKRIKHRLTHLDLANYSFQYATKEASLKALEQKLTELSSKTQEYQQSLHDEEAILVEKKAHRDDSYTALQLAQQKVFDYRSEKDQAQNQSELALLRCEDIQARLDNIKKECLELEDKKKQLDEKAKDDQVIHQQHADLLNASDNIFQQQHTAVEALEKKLMEADNQLYQKKQAILSCETDLQKAATCTQSLELDLKTCQVKRAGLEESQYKLEQQLSQSAPTLQSITREKNTYQEAKDQAHARLQTTHTHNAQIKQSFKDTQKNIQDQERMVARITAQKNALQALQNNLEGFSDGTKALLSGQFQEVIDSEKLHLLTQCISIESPYTHCLELLLGQAVDSVIVENPSVIYDLVSILNDQLLGRACLQVSVSPMNAMPTDIPEFLYPVIPLVQVKNETLFPYVQSLLGGCYIAESIQQALEYIRQKPAFKYHAIATISGELLDSRGLIYAGKTGKESIQNTFLQRSSEIERLETMLQEETKNLDTLHKKAQNLQKELDEAETSIEDIRQELLALEQDLSQAIADERSVQKLINDTQQALKQNENQLDILIEQQDNIQLKLDNAQVLFGQSQKKLLGLRDEIVLLEESIQSLRQEKDIQQQNFNEARFEFSQKKQKLELIENSLNQINQEKAHIHARQESLEKEIKALQHQTVILQEESQNQQARVSQLDRYIQENMKEVESLRVTVLELENAIKLLDESLIVKRNYQHGVDKELSKIELKVSEDRSYIHFLLEKTKTDYEIDLPEIDWKQQLWLADKPFETDIKLDDLEDEDIGLKTLKNEDPTESELEAMESTNWASVQEEAKQLRSRIHTLGAVNLVAIEEYSQLKERYEFLKIQTDDLLKSKNELIQAIETINQTSQNLFQETFEKVRTNFAFTFNQLFGGGEADLILQKSEDNMDSGVDIIARPPGTKLRNLTLLSGGQKTMTAVALLFAIYMVKPSPFCVLDELDAPLDDANIGRFTDMLRQFTQYSQFLVISHNKRTIAASDTIYGVTMQERGVTTLISMNFDQPLSKNQKTTIISEKVIENKVDVANRVQEAVSSVID